MLHRRKEIYEALYPESKAGVKGALVKHGKIDATEIISFAEDTAKKSNLTDRQIRNYIRIAESLPEEVKEAVKEVDLPMIELSFTVSQNKRALFNGIIIPMG